MKENYLEQPLLPLKPPKNKKTEREMISFSNRTNDQISTSNREMDLSEEEELQIRFALANMYQGYLSAIPKLGQRKERESREPINNFEGILPILKTILKKYSNSKLKLQQLLPIENRFEFLKYDPII